MRIKGHPDLSAAIDAVLLATDNKKDKEAKRIRGIEAHNRRDLRHRSPSEWEKQVSRLPVRLQAATAKIIWWDYFAEQSVLERYDHLDPWINLPTPENITDEELAVSLCACGYTPYQSYRRVILFKVNKQFTTYTQNAKNTL